MNCAVCETPLETETEVDTELCSYCSGNPESYKNYNNEGHPDAQSVASVDHIINPSRKVLFRDLRPEAPFEQDYEEEVQELVELTHYIEDTLPDSHGG